MARIDLGTLEAAREIAIDPALRRQNLNALGQQNPGFAHRLTAIQPPSHWRLSSTIDDAWNYRIERNGEPAAWLGASALPRTRAEALLVDCLQSDGNVAICSADGGFELHWLLTRMAAHRAVFLIERDLPTLVAALSAADFSRELSSGRLTLMPPEDPAASLLHELKSHIGLIPPAAVVAFPGVDADWIARVRDACQVAGAESSSLRNAELQELSTNLGRTAEGASSQIAFGAVLPSPLARWIVESVVLAAREAGVNLTASAVDGPRSVHALYHLRNLAAAPIDAAIFVYPGALSVRIAPRLAALHIDELHVPDVVANDDTIHLAASPTIAAALHAAGAPDGRIVPFFWAAPVGTASDAPRSEDVVLFADRPDASCEACRVEQPTHRMIWEQLRKTITKAWENPDITRPEALLVAVERAGGLAVEDPALRRQFVRLIRHILIPHVLVERISMTLAAAGCGLRIVGRGWNAVAGLSCEVQEEPLVLRHDSAGSTPALAIFAGATDPLKPDMLFAAERGWPILIHKAGGGGRVGGLDGVFEPDAHYQTFTTAGQLVDRIAESQRARDTARRRADRTRAHVREYHAWAVRLRQLAAQLSRNGVSC